MRRSASYPWGWRPSIWWPLLAGWTQGAPGQRGSASAWSERADPPGRRGASGGSARGSGCGSSGGQ
eukprot:4132299-Alexandrium_andersonii.AAC.1